MLHHSGRLCTCPDIHNEPYIIQQWDKLLGNHAFLLKFYINIQLSLYAANKYYMGYVLYNSGIFSSSCFHS